MEKSVVQSNDSRLHMQRSHRTPQKRLLSTCVDSIREGLKKLGGCQDVDVNRSKIHHNNVITVRSTPPKKQQSTEARKTRGNGAEKNTENSFTYFHKCVPKIDSKKRTSNWLRQTEFDSDSFVSLTSLPIRGTLLPARYNMTENYAHYCSNDSILTSITSCESARGTHGQGSPPIIEPNMPRLDELFQQLQHKQEKEARRQMVASGEQHLLSFNLLDVYSHQVAGMPVGTTPEILPFMAPVVVPTKPNQRRVIHHHQLQSTYIPPPLNVHRFRCEWLGCSKQFISSHDLFTHVDQCHIQAYKASGNNINEYKISCKWNNCSKTYYARYKLLLHVHSSHCKEGAHQQRFRSQIPNQFLTGKERKRQSQPRKGQQQ